MGICPMDPELRVVRERNVFSISNTESIACHSKSQIIRSKNIWL